MGNVLLLGNGINKHLYGDAVPEWPKLYSRDGKPELRNYTFLYEVCLVRSGKTDNDFKSEILNSFIDVIQPVNIISAKDKGVYDLANLLKEKEICDILTTNVDNGIEAILTELNGFKKPNKDFSESIYSIRRKKQFCEKDQSINIWKIHGDAEKPASVSLGFDQYCGSLAKIEDYVKGTYKIKNKQNEHVKPIIDKFTDQSFDKLSWIELFFRKDIYIACLGMDLSEIDLWWILNKRKRFIELGAPITNKIVFLYSKFDTGENKEKGSNERVLTEDSFREKIILFKTFGVECRKIEAGENLIANIFNEISK